MPTYIRTTFIRNFCKTAQSQSRSTIRPKENTGMVRVLNVAEKNDAAKSIANVMSRGGSRMREGFSRFNKIYEYDYRLFNQNCKMSMTSVSGHLLSLEFFGQYRKWYGCSPAALFDVAVEKFCPEKYNDIKRTLEREIKGCQYLIIWTDCDREGENIGYEVVEVCRKVKPNISVHRARFSEITPGAIQRACNSLVQPDKNVSDAVDVRQELDLRIGAAFTRFQTLRLQKIFPDVLADQLISYGSCQFPTLGFVVERYKQVQAFVPEPFWKLKVTHTQDEENVDFNWKRVRLFEVEACTVLYEHCIENPSATVTDVRCKSKSKWRPNPLDTVELEKLASRKLRINAKETMQIAEKLYTGGFISYPRTETNKFPPDLGLARLVEQQTVDPNWGDFARRVLEHGPNPRNGNKSDQAHPPIHPTKYSQNLQGNEKKVYEFIVRHFLACCSQDAQGQETVVEIDIAEEKFSAQGLMIIARNYLDVYPYDRWNAKVIPVYTKGDTFVPKSIEMNEGETSPPPLLTEADLIALMDKHGIGTDATHAEHIETIKSRMYVGVRPDGKLVPGQLGMGLVEGYDAMGYEMSKPNLRAQLEADLKKICEGKKDKNVVLQEQIQSYKEVFLVACRQALKIDEALSQYLGEARTAPIEEVLDVLASEPVKKCPSCGNDMILKKKKDGKSFYISCMGYPNCRNAIWLPDFVLEAAVEQSYCDACHQKRARNIKFKFKRGSVPPMIPTEYVGCVGGCDELLNETLNLHQHFGSNQRGGNVGQTGGTQNSLSDSGYGSQYNSSFSGNTQNNRTPSSGYGSQYNSSVSGGNTHNNRMPNSRGNNSSTMNNTSVMGNRTSSSVMAGNSRAPLLPVENGSNNVPGNAIVCSCGEDAVQLTVRKEGPNTGRQFYKCGGSKCNFFLWADEASGSGGDTAGGGHAQNRGSNWNAGGNSSAGGDVNCNCGEPCKCLTVQKEGPNKGRQFYCCPKPRGEGCNFFQWQDDSSSSNVSNRGMDSRMGGPQNGIGRGGGGRKRGASDQGSGPSVKRARKCGLCGEEGHTKKTCPHK